MAKRQRPHGTGSLYKRTPHGSWMASWYSHDGQRREASTRTTDRAAAERILAKRLADAALRRGGVIDPRMDRHADAARVPFVQHVADWHKAVVNKGVTSKHADLLQVRVTALVNGCGFVLWPDVTPSRVVGWLAEQRAAGQSVQTGNFYLGAVKQFAKWMIREGRAAYSPVAHLQGRTERGGFEPPVQV